MEATNIVEIVLTRSLLILACLANPHFTVIDRWTMTVNHINPPFRAEHIGSLVRPDSLLQKRQQLQEGKASREELATEEDKAIAEAVKMQEDVGIRGITDGEFRRVSGTPVLIGLGHPQ